MARPTIITCAVTGGGALGKNSGAVPVTPMDIAQSAIDAAKAGAAIAHIHVRDPQTGKPSSEFALYEEVVDRVRASGTDVILNLTTGAGARFVPSENDPRQGTDDSTLMMPERRVEHIAKLKPEICTLDIATMNFGEHVFLNTPAHLRTMAKAITAAGVLPELEAFEPGHILLARKMIEDGLLPEPPLVQLCLGISWGTPATPEAMIFMKNLLPQDARWSAFGISRHQFPMVAQAVVLGGHVRVGLEDNLYLGPGELAPSNAALVERAAKIVSLLGAEPATPRQARAALGLGVA